MKVSPLATITMPWHTEVDGYSEDNAKKGKIGTTKKGIGPTYTDKMARIALKIEDLYSKEALEEKLDVILPLKNNDICVYGQEEKLNIISMKNQNILFNLTGIESSVASLFELNDGRIFVCTYDSKITIFNRLNGNIDIILFNLFSIPKYFFQCENYALFVVKFNGDVDVLGLSNYQDINNNITFSENIIQFDIDERF